MAAHRTGAGGMCACVGGGETQRCLGRFALGVRSDGAATTLGNGLSASPLEGRNLVTGTCPRRSRLEVLSGTWPQVPQCPGQVSFLSGHLCPLVLWGVCDGPRTEATGVLGCALPSPG